MQYAIEVNTKKRIHIDAATYTRDGGNYHCEVCGQRVHKRILNNQAFFYHDGEAEIYCTKDTWDLEETTSWHKRMQNRLKESILGLQLEKYLKFNDEVHRADAYLKTEHNEVVIEIQNSPISVEQVTQRNAFYTTRGQCVWILNTSKHFASGEITTKRSYTGGIVIESDNLLIRNVVQGCNEKSLVCLQKNEGDFIFVLDMCISDINDSVFAYHVSQTYTWEEIIDAIQSYTLPLYTTVSQKRDFDDSQRYTPEPMTSYQERKYYPQYEQARRAKTISELIDILNTHPIDIKLYSIALNHPCTNKSQHPEAWNELMEYVIPNQLTYPIAELFVAYLDEEDDTLWFTQLLDFALSIPFWRTGNGLLQYYCAKKTKDAEILHQLSFSTNEQVRIMVAHNQSTPHEVIQSLCHDESLDVARAAYSHMDTNYILRQLHKNVNLQKMNDTLVKELDALQQAYQATSQQLDDISTKYKEAQHENYLLTCDNNNKTNDIKGLKSENNQLSTQLQTSVHDLKTASQKNFLQKYQLPDTQITMSIDDVEAPMKHLCEWITQLQQQNANGDFLFLFVDSPRQWQWELHCVHISPQECKPKWFLGYAIGKVRCNKKYPITSMRNDHSFCYLVTQAEAIAIFGEKYYNSPLQKHV